MVETKLSPAPRWFYRFLDWMESTPFNGWLYTLGLIAIGIVLTHWPAWQSDALDRFQLDPDLLFSAAWFPVNLAFWQWMNRVAKRALGDFGRGLGKSERETASIYNDFISIKQPWGTLILLLGLTFGYVEAVGSTSGSAAYISGLWPALGSALESLGVVRIFRQLILVNRLYGSIKKINLFNLWPVYALSRYGYNLALFIIVATIALHIVIELVTGSGLALALILYIAASALLLFLAPLVGINARLRREKEDELQRLGNKLSAVYRETETAIEKRKLEKVGALRNATSALREQLEAIQKIATWPWNPGSIRNLLLPVLLPLLIAVLQRYVLTALGF